MAEGGLELEVRGLSVTGDEGRPILRLDTLSLAPGQSLGVRGPSGAGKTTLIFALAGLMPRVAGRVAWGGTDLVAAAPAARRAFRAANIGLVFQDFPLFDELSPGANAGIFALFSRREARAGIRARAGDLLRRLQVPDGRAGTASLSGGERQRVALARALAQDPAIVLADEPTASLHREAADRIVDDLATLARDAGRTVVAASHDTRLLDRMDRVLELGAGTRVAT